jgi:hypothetical protein
MGKWEYFVFYVRCFNDEEIKVCYLWKENQYLSKNEYVGFIGIYQENAATRDQT